MPKRKETAGEGARPNPRPGMEHDFPRGGGEALSNVEILQARQEAENEVREANGPAAKRQKKEKGKKRASEKVEGDDSEVLQGGVKGKLPKFVELLKFKTLSPGLHIWGSVAEVSNKDLVISLPNGLRGFVNPTDASDVLADMLKASGDTGGKKSKKKKKKGEVRDKVDDEDLDEDKDIPLLTEIFTEGQLVACTVKGLGSSSGKHGGKADSKRVELSLCPSLLNEGLTIDAIHEGMALTACVKSVEDHGFVLTFGVPLLSGFLLKRDLGEGGALRKGQLVQCVAGSIDKQRKTVGVKTDPKLVAAAAIQEHDGLTLETLKPGALVSAKVRSVLPDGLLLSFLTYFTGTVDRFHLDEDLLSADWAGRFTENQRLKARVLFVDPASKRVGLTLKPALVAGQTPQQTTSVGDLFEDAVVRRVDPVIGLTLELPTPPKPSAGFAHISNVSDERVEKLEKKFRPGQKVRARVVGHWGLEGLATVSLRPSVVEQKLLTYDDVIPGMEVRGTVVSVEDWGARLQLSDSIRAICPLAHMSEVALSKPSPKFQVGARVKCRVLSVDPKEKKVAVTYKKGLVASKLTLLTSYEQAVEGLVTHGVVTGVQEYGCFVQFYNNVKGLTHRSELGIPPGSSPEEAFQLGQVIKCRVLRSSSADQRLALSFITSSAAIAAAHAAGTSTNGSATSPTVTAPGATVAGQVELGALVSGAVRTVGESSFIVEVARSTGGNVNGVLGFQHLSDHGSQVEGLKALLQPRQIVADLLVIDKDDVKGLLILSWKKSLIDRMGKGEMPGSLADLQPQQALQGYVASSTPKGVFVRFLGRLTGMATVSQLSDSFVSDPAGLFTQGQSVRAKVVEINENLGRFTLTTKQSQCFSPDATYLKSFFAAEQKIAKLRSEQEDTSLDWVSSYPIGGIVSGKIQESKDYGYIVNLPDHEDIVGFITHHQAGGELEVGADVRARVLDVGIADGIVDVTVRQELLGEEDTGKKKKKSKKPAPAALPDLLQKVEAVVQLVKDDYLVFTLPQFGNAVAYAATKDYNWQGTDPHKSFKPGQKLLGTVHELPQTAHERLLLLLPFGTDSLYASKASDGSVKKGSKPPRIEVGTIVKGRVTSVKALQLNVELDRGLMGRVHVTEVTDDYPGFGVNPLMAFKPKQELDFRVVGYGQTPAADARRSFLELSLKPSEIANPKWDEIRKGVSDGTTPDAHVTDARLAPQSVEAFEVGKEVVGYIEEIGAHLAGLGVSTQVRGRLHVVESASDPSDMRKFKQRFKLGDAVKCRVVAVDAKTHSLELSCKALGSSVNGRLEVGDVVTGRVSKVLPGIKGLLVQVGIHTVGHVAITELGDRWRERPLEGFATGQFVKCAVLDATENASGNGNGNGNGYELSLREKLGGCGGEEARAARGEKAGQGLEVPRVAAVEDLSPGQEVWGYVKSCSPKGCFVTLGPNIDARILMANLSTSFIDDPAKEFPPGTLVHGWVISAEPLSGRVELTLKQTGVKDARTAQPKVELSGLEEGQIVTGVVKSVTQFGLFVTLDNSKLTALCHVFEVSDKFLKDLSQEYEAGDRVRAVVKKVDLEKQRVSIVMKKSALQEAHVNKAGRGKLENGVGNGSDDVIENGNGSGGESDGEEDAGAAAEEREVGSDGEEAGAAEDGSKSEEEAAGDDEEENDEEEESEDLAPATNLPPALEVTFDDAEDDVMGAETSKKRQRTEADEEEAGVSAEDLKDSKQARKRQKKKAREEKEAAIARAEAARLQGDSAPETVEDFERLILASPNSSFVWIKYMAFMLSLTEVDKARAVAERALQTISYREESEKLNVWVAYLNLENMHGSPDPKEAVLTLFRRALAYTDQKKLHLALLGIYERTGQHEMADTLFKSMNKKFNTSAKVWLRNIQNLLTRNLGDAASKVLERALKSLPQRKHIKVISRAAVLEYKLGTAERARVLMEGVLRNYPKRVDLWSVYLDQEIKLGDQPVIRGLFERAICLELPAKKMKFLFKKYLEYEKQHGDEASVDRVKKAAMEYVENKLS